MGTDFVNILYLLSISSYVLTEFSEISGAGPPPPGVKPNFEHPESIGYRIIIGSLVSWWSATLVLFLRLYARRYVTHMIAAEDCKCSGHLE